MSLHRMPNINRINNQKSIIHLNDGPFDLFHMQDRISGLFPLKRDVLSFRILFCLFLFLFFNGKVILRSWIMQQFMQVKH